MVVRAPGQGLNRIAHRYKKAPGTKRKLDETAMKLLEEDLRARPTATYEQRAKFLDEFLGVRGEQVHHLPDDQAPGLLPKRSVGASERDEWLRAAWKTMISTLDAQRLVFVDEMGTKAAREEPTSGLEPLTCSLRVCSDGLPYVSGSRTTFLDKQDCPIRCCQVFRAVAPG